EKAKVEESLAEQDWKINSTLAYASIVLATEQYQFALKDSALFEEINNINKERFLAGRGSSEDYSLSQQEVQRKKILMHESWSILQEANLELGRYRSEEHTSELQSRENLVCRLLLEKKKKQTKI